MGFSCIVCFFSCEVGVSFVIGGRGVLERLAHVEHSAHDPAVAAYKDIFSKGAMEGPGKTISKAGIKGMQSLLLVSPKFVGTS